MLSALPVFPLLASTMVSPGRSSPSRSARSIMYLAMRALIDPDGFRCSSLTHIPSTMIRGVLPIASRIVPPARGGAPACASPVALMAAPYAHTDSMPVRLHHVVIDAHDLPGLARFWTQALGWRILS